MLEDLIAAALGDALRRYQQRFGATAEEQLQRSFGDDLGRFVRRAIVEKYDFVRRSRLSENRLDPFLEEPFVIVARQYSRDLQGELRRHRKVGRVALRPNSTRIRSSRGVQIGAPEMNVRLQVRTFCPLVPCVDGNDRRPESRNSKGSSDERS